MSPKKVGQYQRLLSVAVPRPQIRPVHSHVRMTWGGRDFPLAPYRTCRTDSGMFVYFFMAAVNKSAPLDLV